LNLAFSLKARQRRLCLFNPSLLLGGGLGWLHGIIFPHILGEKLFNLLTVVFDGNRKDLQRQWRKHENRTQQPTLASRVAK